MSLRIGIVVLLTALVVGGFGLALGRPDGAVPAAIGAAADWCTGVAPVGVVAGGGFLGSGVMGFWTNNGSYMPRIHCMVDQEGASDWPWIIALIIGNLAVMGWYLRIFLFWRKSYLAEAPRDRNVQMNRLAVIFLFCGLTGYAFSAVMFVWPAYRLLAVFLVALAAVSWLFCLDLNKFAVSLQANRLERELAESLAARNSCLEAEVAERTQQVEIARREAENASAAKTAFLANMSHELRTPLTAMLGFADVLDDESIDPAERRGHAETIRRNGRHLLELVNGVLDLSKVEAGRLEVERLEMSPASIAAEVVSLLQVRAKSMNTRLSVSVESPLPETVLGDPTRLRQILLNLVGNAVKFTRDGRVRVVLSADEGPGGCALTVAVQDTGIGIPEDRLDAIFEPFAQGDASMSRRHGGTGLGLTVSRRLAELMGGSLRVYSVEGEGSTFTLEVPCGVGAGVEWRVPVFKEPVEESQGVIPAASLRGRRILLAEDGEDNQRLFAMLLERAGASVVRAETGVEAVEALGHAGPFDLVLMDMQMPEMDGYQATRRAREMGHLGPILALTAHAMDGDRDKCLAAGCDDHLTKPIRPRAFIEACASWCDGGVPGVPSDAA